MNKDNIIYWVATGLLSLLMLFSANMYFFNYDNVSQVFTKLGYPTYIIYPLAIAKILGVIAIISKKSVILKNLAYAGFLFDFLLAASAHININDGEHAGALVALVLLTVSFIYDRKIFTD